MSNGDRVKALQLMLRSDGASVAVDGNLGPQTEQALSSSRGKVGEIARSIRSTIPAVSATGRWISRGDAYSLIQKAAARYSVQSSWLYYMLEREPFKMGIGDATQYRVDSHARGSSFWGLMQMGKDAWTDAIALDATLPSLSSGWADAETNVRAAAAFAAQNRGYARKLGYGGDLTDEIVYAMHNQGNSFILSAKNGGRGEYYNGQSAAARAALDVASVQVFGYFRGGKESRRS